MSQTWWVIGFFVLFLALIPVGLKWLQRRLGVVAGQGGTPIRIVSAVGVGPHQRVVTVEVGPEGSRTWLTLGVTGQSITCLHTAPVTLIQPPSPPLVPVEPL